MKISVAMCTYNGERFLAQQLDSILNQTYQVSEIVICDDQSSDGTLALVKAFQERHPGIIQLHINESNLGGKKNFEKAYALCTGDIVFFSDQDDVWLPIKVERIVNAFQANANILGVATDSTLINEQGEQINHSFWNALEFFYDGQDKQYSLDPVDYILRYDNFISGASIAVRKEARPLIFPFQLLEDMWHDEWIVLSLGSRQQFMLLNECLIQYRIHTTQQIGLSGSVDEGWHRHMRDRKKRNYLLERPSNYFLYTSRTYYRTLKYKKFIPGLVRLLPAYIAELDEAKQLFLKQDPFFKRKLRILYWWLRGRFRTRLSDVYKL